MSEPDESSEGEPEEAPTAAKSDLEAEEMDDAGEEVEASREELAARVEELEDALAEVRAERDELTSKVKRKAADFENYKKRQAKRREQLAAEATERLIERLLDVRDNLKRAIDQEGEDVESLREGLKLTLAEFDRVLDAEGVSEIAPDPGTEVDPERHEVMLRVDSEFPAGHIDEIYQPGYELGEKVLRPAQVTVADAEPDSEAEAEAEGESATDR